MDHPLTAYERVDLIRSIKGDRKIMVETGTADGFTANALSGDFERLFTIELAYSFYQNAYIRFAQTPTVIPLYGDSTIVLPMLLDALGGPHNMVLWLDAHDNGDTPGAKRCPLLDELEHVFYRSPEGSMILIDDVHLFGIDPDYPTVDAVLAFCYARGYEDVKVADGVMRVST